jgi:Fe-S cluster biogenesis protein NfuA
VVEVSGVVGQAALAEEAEVDTAADRAEVIEAMSRPNLGENLKSRVEAVIDREVRPGLIEDGGDVEVVGVDADRIVQIRLLGSCQGCASSIYSTTMGIEAAVKAAIPEVRFLEAVL